jgi:hypothetical protein
MEKFSTNFVLAGNSSLDSRVEGCEGFSPLLREDAMLLLPSPMISLRLHLQKLTEHQVFSL